MKFLIDLVRSLLTKRKAHLAYMLQQSGVAENENETGIPFDEIKDNMEDEKAEKHKKGAVTKHFDHCR